MWTKFLIKVHPSADSLWRNPIFWWALLGIGAILCIWWLRYVPSPGKAIAAMGVVAAISAIRGEMGGLEKLCWTAILFVFLLLEIRAINKDRTESQHRFTTMLESITGGDSYAVVLPMIGSGRLDNQVVMAIQNRGSNILTGVSVTIHKTNDWQHEKMVEDLNRRINVGTLHPHKWLALTKTQNPADFRRVPKERLQQNESNVFRAYIFIAAQNYTSIEVLDFKKNTSNHWVFRYTIYPDPDIAGKEGPPKPVLLLEAVDWSSDPYDLIWTKTPDWDQS